MDRETGEDYQKSTAKRKWNGRADFTLLKG